MRPNKINYSYLFIEVAEIARREQVILIRNFPKKHAVTVYHTEGRISFIPLRVRARA